MPQRQKALPSGPSLAALTLRENARAQLFWVSAAALPICFLLSALFSQAALSHEGRLVATSSYFLLDLACVLAAAGLGAAFPARDFSPRGIAEPLVPRGFSRPRILLWRLAGHIAAVSVMALSMGALRAAFLAVLGSVPSGADLLIPVFAALKSMLTLCIAAALGCLARPLIAMLGALALLGAGFITTGLGRAGAVSTFTGVPEALVDPVTAFFLRLLSIWDPGQLTLESVAGAWVVPEASGVACRVLWALCACLPFVAAAAFRVSRSGVTET